MTRLAIFRQTHALLLCFGLGMFSHPALTADLYVATNGANTGSRTNWSTAYTNIQDALLNVTNGGTIYLAGHTFYLTNQLVWANNANVAIWGGYAATNDAGLPGTNDATRWPTVLTPAAGLSIRILSITNITTGTLGRVTLTGGYLTAGNCGAGIYVSNCVELTLARCAIMSNTNKQADAVGGGLYAVASSIVVSNCQVMLNQGVNTAWNISTAGGGIYFAGGGVLQVQDSVIANNSVYGYTTTRGGGLYGAGTVIVSNNLIYGNWASVAGGGVYGAGRLTLGNNLIYGNYAVAGGGVYGAAGTTTTVANCTIADNLSHGVYGAGTVMAVTNSILYGNTDDVTGAVRLVYCDIGDGDSNGVNGCTNGNPLFEYGYYLATNSVCHGIGTNSAAAWGLTNYTTRIDGAPDTNQNVDLGYHYAAGFDLTYADVYVATNGSDDANSGTNWSQAFRSITKAIAVMRNGTRIHVGPGQFTNGVETFPLQVQDLTGWQLQGSDSALTVIDAQRSNRVFTLQNNSGSVRIADVTIKGGVAYNNTGTIYGGGLYIRTCKDLTLANCVLVTNGVSAVPNWSPLGGAIYSSYSGLTISNCSVLSNFVTVTGGGSGAASPSGAGLYVSANIYLCLRNSILSYNQAAGANLKRGGCLFLVDTPASMVNVVLSDNTAPHGGGGIYMDGGSLAAVNCTIADNNYGGLGLDAASVALTNSIFWGNAGYDLAGTGSVSVAYCNLQNYMMSGTRIGSIGVNGNLSADPQFVASATNNYRLNILSPCIDAGINQPWMAGARDLDGERRTYNGKVDLGAYENWRLRGNMLGIH